MLKALGLLAAVVALMCSTYAAGRSAGAAAVQARWDQAQRDQALADLRGTQKAAEVSAAVGLQVQARVDQVRSNTQAVRERIHDLVTPAADARCVVPVGFVRAHDAAAQALPPLAAGPAADAASGVALSAVGDVVAGNYGLCNTWREQLIGWQGWWAELQAKLAEPPY